MQTIADEEKSKFSEEEVLERSKKILSQVADMLENEGWCQYTMHQPNVNFDHPKYNPYNRHPDLQCPRCPLAAIYVVMLRYHSDLDGRDKKKVGKKVGKKVYKIIKDDLKTDIHKWNDEPTRTKTEVVDKFRFLAK